MTEELIKALRDITPPPCSSCPHYMRCAKAELACQAFFYYVVHGWSAKEMAKRPEPKEPKEKKIYREMTCISLRTPTREMFVEARKDNDGKRTGRPKKK